MEKETIGKSDKSGTKAIFIPSFLLYFIVSVITKINNGPGDIPATNPNVIPVIK